jgi:CRP-like cAMP-binding protein
MGWERWVEMDRRAKENEVQIRLLKTARRIMQSKKEGTRKPNELQQLKQWVDTSVPALQSLPQPALLEFLKHVQYLTYKPGEVVFRQGDCCKELYVMMHGSVDVHVMSEKKNEKAPPPQKLHVVGGGGDVTAGAVGAALGFMAEQHSRRKKRKIPKLTILTPEITQAPEDPEEKAEDEPAVDEYVAQHGMRVAVKRAGEVFGEQAATASKKMTGRTATIVATPMLENEGSVSKNAFWKPRQQQDGPELIELLMVSQSLYRRTMMDNAKRDDSIQLAQNVDFFTHNVSFATSWRQDQIIAFVYAMELRTFRYGQRIPADCFVVIRSGSVKLVKKFKAKSTNKLHNNTAATPGAHGQKSEHSRFAALHELDIAILGHGDFLGGKIMENKGRKLKKETTVGKDSLEALQAVANSESVEALILTKEKYDIFLHTARTTYINHDFVRRMQNVICKGMVERQERTKLKLTAFASFIANGTSSPKSEAPSMNTSLRSSIVPRVGK